MTYVDICCIISKLSLIRTEKQADITTEVRLMVPGKSRKASAKEIYSESQKNKKVVDKQKTT